MFLSKIHSGKNPFNMVTNVVQDESLFHVLIDKEWGKAKAFS